MDTNKIIDAQKEAIKNAIFALSDEQLRSRDILIHEVCKALSAPPITKTMDEDGYPDDEELERIRNWPHTDFPGLIEYDLNMQATEPLDCAGIEKLRERLAKCAKDRPMLVHPAILAGLFDSLDGLREILDAERQPFRKLEKPEEIAENQCVQFQELRRPVVKKMEGSAE